MHALVLIGNLRRMSNWRIAGLVVAALLAAWLILRGCTSKDENERATSPPVPAREVFHISKPLRVLVTRPATSASQPAQAAPTASGAQGTPDEWLERELRDLLIRGRMRIAAIDPSLPRPFTLRVELPQAPGSATSTTVKLSLQAPDGKIERSTEVELTADPGRDPSALHIMQALAKRLPGFLGAARIAAGPEMDWSALIGTDDAAAYDRFLSSANELLGSQGTGFTASSAPNRSVAVERLETLTRRHPDFTRALALLSVGYAGLGGQDDASLTGIAAASAQRALAMDRTLANAQSTLGLVRLRQGEWAAALEQFDAALTLDANSPAALEGLACLLIDVGQAAAALPVAQRAVALQPANVGAKECLAYALFATGKNADSLLAPPSPTARDPLEIAQVKALPALLSGDTVQAQRTLSAAAGTGAAWVDPVLQAVGDRKRVSLALQAITRAASDRTIDPTTELVCGAALRQADFVFNRMLRLHRQDEPVPLRLLWLPQTDFLRRHARFAEIIDAQALPVFWQDHGRPDYCSQEPDLYGCKSRIAAAAPARPRTSAAVP